MEKLILAITFILLNVKVMYSQRDTLEVDVNLLEYKKVADNTLNENFFISSNLPENVFQIIDSLKLIPYHYKLEDLKTYSIPVFKLKRDADSYDCNKNIIRFIDFTNNYYKQHVNIEFKDSLISMTSVEIEKKQLKHPLDYMPYLLFLDDGKTLLPLPGFDVYAIKERLEKKFFTFFIEGFDPYFVINEGRMYAVKMVNTYNGKKDLLPKDLMEYIRPEFIEVNEYVRKNLGAKAINDIINYGRRKQNDRRKYTSCNQTKLDKEIYVIVRYK
ncbi:hypothetical protein ED312_23095 [Sinomicrobium pectinilyticum]|uniref:Uncharacterized protein n=1 Tax=Sinomicrobium pectinilyticum TaxID=1084421 RepID=A0A3N0CYX7_SINP1|nr:hypothetical protein [Sinomicrobium pectinilyticum]RNL68618.1 hypothetical protein ED312_23095 [Sinomicrobium pectinilyticum]